MVRLRYRQRHRHHHRACANRRRRGRHSGATDSCRPHVGGGVRLVRGWLPARRAGDGIPGPVVNRRDERLDPAGFRPAVSRAGGPHHPDRPDPLLPGARRERGRRRGTVVGAGPGPHPGGGGRAGATCERVRRGRRGQRHRRVVGRAPGRRRRGHHPLRGAVVSVRHRQQLEQTPATRPTARLSPSRTPA